MIRTTAPGKIILFGEHAVVYGRPALAVPVTQVHANVETDLAVDKQNQLGAGEEDWQSHILIDAPDIGLFSTLQALCANFSPHALASVIEAARQSLGLDALPPMRLRVTSSIPVASGLGSGAAVSVALARAVAGAVGQSLSDEQVNAIAYEVEKLHHGTPSGIDNTVITYARPVYFIRGQPIETFGVGAPFTILIGDTGICAPTRESVADVRRLWQANKPHWESVFDQVGEIVQQARESIESGKVNALGPLMNANHALLQAMTVSGPELDRLVEAACGAGALGAKLSGGGRGGNMIALVENDKSEAVKEALYQANAKNVILTQVR